MSDPDSRPPGGGGAEPSEEIPLGQRLLDRPFLLLIVSQIIFFGSYTIWGAIEMFTLSPAPLP